MSKALIWNGDVVKKWTAKRHDRTHVLPFVCACSRLELGKVPSQSLIIPMNPSLTVFFGANVILHGCRGVTVVDHWVNKVGRLHKTK